MNYIKKIEDRELEPVVNNQGPVIRQKKKNHKHQKLWQKLQDRLLLESTGRCQAEPFFDQKGKILSLKGNLLMGWVRNNKSPLLFKPRRCYVCKNRFHEVHHFYHQLCSQCSEENFLRRSQTANLTGRVALVTGGRVKIGFEIALKLLRSGAKVIVTTRFPNDAAQRFSKQEGFSKWGHQLCIYGLDLKHIPSVEAFCEYMNQRYESLDIIINNAAQTLRKPEEYYVAMAQREQSYIDENYTEENEIKSLLGDFEDIQLIAENKQLLEKIERCQQIARYCDVKLDEFNEPIDIRGTNSWVKCLEEINTLEFLEAQTINVTAPFILNSRLKMLLKKSCYQQKFIVNVSAMEGQFNRENKTCRHPHTNMAKAALNMMTRTSALDYIRDQIYMTSVDTGWVTQENPFPRKVESRQNGMVPALDCVDGASRVLAPVFDAIEGNTPQYGCFLKDYEITEW